MTVLPPPSGAPYIDPEPRIWHKVIGVLAALWGGVGLLWSVVSLASGRDDQPEVMRGQLGQVLLLVGAALSLMLLVGGVQLLRCSPAGVRLLRGWAPLSAIAQAVGLALMLDHRAEFEQAVRERLTRDMEARAAKLERSAPAMPEGIERWMVGAGIGCGGISALVPPGIAAFFVFGRRGREALAEWSTGAV
jgi:hypothetical protein